MNNESDPTTHQQSKTFKVRPSPPRIPPRENPRFSPKTDPKISPERKVQAPPDIRELTHITMSRGRVLMDKLHFTGWKHFSPDDYSSLWELAGAFQTFPDSESSDMSEMAGFFQAALGTEDFEEMRDAVGVANRTLNTICNGGVEAVGQKDFYTAQELVRAVWEVTAPIPEVA